MDKRGRKARGIGDNSSGEPLTDDEFAALTQYYSLKARAQLRVAAQAKSLYDLEREEVNGWFAKAKGDLGYNRKEFTELLAAQDKTESEFIRSEARRNRLFSSGGLPVSGQLELALGDTVDDKHEAYANGYRAGRRADDPIPPDNIATFLHPDWLKGWHDAQTDNVMQLEKAETILAARGKPASSLEPAEADEPGGPTDDETEFAEVE